MYTHADRVKQLTGLSRALERLCLHLKETGLFPEMLPIYTSCNHDVETLLTSSFSQSELSEQSRAIPDLYNRHKEWCPPLEQTASGMKEPGWFIELEAHLHPVLESARRLRETGYY